MLFKNKNNWLQVIDTSNKVVTKQRMIKQSEEGQTFLWTNVIIKCYPQQNNEVGHSSFLLKT